MKPTPLMAPQVRDLLELCDELRAYDRAFWREPQVVERFLSSEGVTVDEHVSLTDVVGLCVNYVLWESAIDQLVKAPELFSGLRAVTAMFQRLQTFLEREGLRSSPVLSRMQLDAHEARVTSAEQAVARWTNVHVSMQTHCWSTFYEYRLTSATVDEREVADGLMDTFLGPLLAVRDRFFVEPALEHLEQYVKIAESLNKSEHPLLSLRDGGATVQRKDFRTAKAGDALEQLIVASLMASVLGDGAKE